MLAQIHSAALSGLAADAIEVEIDSSRGMPSWEIVGFCQREQGARPHGDEKPGL